MAVPVYLLDNSSMQLQYAMTATVASCLDSLAASLELQSADGFMLYESIKVLLVLWLPVAAAMQVLVLAQCLLCLLAAFRVACWVGSCC